MDYNTALQKLNQHLNSYRNSLPSSGLNDPIKYIISLGGKRIRPALLVWINQMYGGDLEEALEAATAIEIFHNFTLVHDDIMDYASLRRGKPTVHEKWNTNAAILSGDAMLIQVYQRLERINETHLADVLKRLNKSAMDVCIGQQMDMDFETAKGVSVHQYLEMIGKKTGDLLGASLAIGGLLADAKKEDVDHLYQFGLNIGISFQIHDDLLDLFGDQEKVGKIRGGDILAHKKTYLWLCAFEKANTEQMQALVQMQKESRPDVKVDLALKIFNELHVHADAETAKKYYENEAWKHLKKTGLSEKNKTALTLFVKGLMKREF